MNRGIINNKGRARQLRDFSGLRYGNITPTDIDALIEYKDRAYVIVEFKFGEADVPTGQMIALTRLCDDLQNYKHTILIIARHDYPIEQDINAANSVVEKYRWMKKWNDMRNNPYTVRKLIDWFLESDNVKSSE